jgi:signal transduction histidine kinase
MTWKTWLWKRIMNNDSLDPVISGYFYQEAPVFFLLFDKKGEILKTNQYTKEISGTDICGKRITDVFLNLSPSMDPEDFLTGPGTVRLLNVNTITGLPQTFYFHFYQLGNQVAALGKFNIKEMESLGKKLISMNHDLNNLTRQLHKANAELRIAREELEKRVLERTVELSAANVKLIEENQERQRAEKSLRKSREELLHLSSRLLDAQEDERKRIASDLHDGLAQTLSAIDVWVGEALTEIQLNKTTGAQKSLESARKLAQQAIDEVQRISKHLRPAMLDNLGLVDTIRWSCKEFKKVHPDTNIRINLDVPEIDVPEALKIVIFRIMQEAMNNIAKHSHATRIKITIKLENNYITLTIEDNGRGFDLKKVIQDKSSRRGLGLESMKDRTELSGGTFALTPRPGIGTTIQANWPVN